MIYNLEFVFGAYGREYADKDAMLADWHGGRDFRFIPTKYFSIRDVEILCLSGIEVLCFQLKGGVQYFLELDKRY